MQLRWYQEEAVDSVFEYFATKTGNPLIAMPTGTGKSPVLASFIYRAMVAYPRTRVIMLTHIKELIAQNMSTLLRVWPNAPAGIYSAGLRKKDLHLPITFAGIASVHNIANQFGKIDLIVIDEAHLVSPNDKTMYRAFIGKLKKVNPHLKVIGLTATAYRLGTGMLIDGGLFTDICYDITTTESFNQLVAEGFLAPLVTKHTALQYDVDSVKIVGGEYDQRGVQDVVDHDNLTLAACQEVAYYGANRRQWLTFASGIDHVMHVFEAYRSLGVSTTYVHSKMSDGDRDRNIADYKAGKYQSMVNSGILTTGHDFPWLDLIAIMTATNSTNRWVQMLGRGTRVFHSKIDCLVLDFAQNTKRLGPINDPVIPRKKGKGKGTAPVRICPQCSTYNHASATACIYCGCEFPRELKIEMSASSNEVMKIVEPIVEDFKVTSVTYAKHVKAGSEFASMRVTYYCGLRDFKEFINLEHTNFAGKRARDWWRSRCTSMEPPASVDIALQNTQALREPTLIKVHMNAGKYMQIINYAY